MSGFSFDTSIIVDTLRGVDQARAELERAVQRGGRLWISRIVRIDVMAQCADMLIDRTERFLDGFGVDEVDDEIGARAAALRRERPGIGPSAAIILATALIRGRVLVTSNNSDFPANMPGVRIPYTL